MELYEEKFLQHYIKDNSQKSIPNLIMSFIIFLTVAAAILSLHISNIKQENNSKKIISESITWFADIEKTASFLLDEKNAENLLNESNLNNYIPIANIPFANPQKKLNTADLTTYLQTSIANKLYFLGHAAFNDSEIELSYRENKNRFLIYNFYDFISKQSLEKIDFIHQVSMVIFFIVSIALIWINLQKAFFLIGVSICCAAFPLIASAIGTKIGMNIFFPSNDMVEFYQNYVNQFASDVQVSAIIIFIVGLIVIIIGWFLNNLLVNNSID